MTGLVCLQGGGEFSPGCVPMDTDLARRAGGRVVVTALAGTVGRDYRTATDNGVRHFRGLGATDVVAAPDVREDPEGALAALRTARLLVLPGGSPSRLLAALLSIDLVVHRGNHAPTAKRALVESAAWVACGLAFSVVVLLAWGGQAFGEYMSGYVIEKSLAVDNVFVWAIIFAAFAVPREHQHRVLFLGVLGALVLRGVFIASHQPSWYMARFPMVSKYCWVRRSGVAGSISESAKLTPCSGSCSTPSTRDGAGIPATSRIVAATSVTWVN